VDGGGKGKAEVDWVARVGALRLRPARGIWSPHHRMGGRTSIAWFTVAVGARPAPLVAPVARCSLVAALSSGGAARAGIAASYPRRWPQIEQLELSLCFLVCWDQGF
jgi:hypothetical protein